MKTIASVALTEGMELAEDVLGLQGQVILSAGTVIDKTALIKLSCHKIMCVSIKDATDFATTSFERIRSTNEFQIFEENYKNNLSAYKYMVQSFLNTRFPLNINYLLQMHEKVYSCTSSREMLLDMLYNMVPSEDDITYSHCFNAALISTIFGTWLGFEQEKLKLATLCGFFYDIGKCKLPNRLLWKPGKLNEFEFNWMKTHTQIGYDLLKNQKLNEHIKNAAFMHHERCDGSGYPNKLVSEEIDFYARFIAIVDAYEAMTSARTYRSSLNPFEVIYTFETSGFGTFDFEILHPILVHLANHQLGKTVLFQNDMEGEVILINVNELSKPIVKTVDGIINLAKDTQYKIISVL